MKLLLFIGIGGFIGSVLRYLVSIGVQDKWLKGFPSGTLIVNALGCFVIGVLFIMTEKGYFSPESRLFFITGICGGFTTFSSFSIETVALIRDGQFLYAASYIIASVILSLAATFAGVAFGKMI